MSPGADEGAAAAKRITMRPVNREDAAPAVAGGIGAMGAAHGGILRV